MNIGLIVHRFPPAVGGSERFTEVLAENLHTTGHDVTVYTTRHPDRDAAAFPYAVVEFANRVPENFGYFGWPGVFAPRVLRSLRNHDAVHAVGADMFSAVVGAVAKRFLGTTAVLTTFYHPPERQAHARLKRLYDRTVLQRVLETYDYLHVSSAFEHEQLRRNFDLTDCTLVRLAVPPTVDARPTVDFREANDLGDAFLVVYVGRLDSHKGMESLLPAIEAVGSELPSLRCVIVGEEERWHDWPASVVATVERNAERFVFTGVLTGGDLAAVYDAADVFVFPSEYETYGLVTVEALRFGTPVIANEVGIAPELLTDGANGYLYAAPDPEALGDLIRRTANGDLDAMKARAAESVAGLSWRDLIAEFRRLYTS